MSDTAAQALFIAGAGVVIAAGTRHMWMAFVDAARPRYFVPRDRSLRPAMESVHMRLGGGTAPSMWSVWRGIHLTHSLGLIAFGVLCLAIATYDFGLVVSIDAIRPLAIAISAAYLAISLRFFFYGPVVITATATACFTIATVLSA
jgi:hypothetical protein